MHHAVDLGPPAPKARHTYRAADECTAGCLAGPDPVATAPSATSSTPGRAEIRTLRAGSTGTSTAVDLDNAAGAPGSRALAARTSPATALSWPGQPAHARGHLVRHSAGRPARQPSGQSPRPGRRQRSALPFGAGLPGRHVTAPTSPPATPPYTVLGRLPRYPAPVAAASSSTWRPWRPAPRCAGPSTYDVWLAADDPAREEPCVAGSPTTGCRSWPGTPPGTTPPRSPAKGRPSRCGSRCSPALVAVVLAAAVLVVGVATSGASRARDLAGLRVVGVPAPRCVGRLGPRAPRGRGAGSARRHRPGARRGPGGAARRPPVRDAGPGHCARAGAGLVPVLVTVAAALLLLTVVSVVVGRSLAASAVPATGCGRDR